MSIRKYIIGTYAKIILAILLIVLAFGAGLMFGYGKILGKNPLHIFSQELWKNFFRQMR